MNKVTALLALSVLIVVWQASARTALAQQGAGLPPEAVGVEWQLVTLQEAGGAAEDTTGQGMTLLLEAEGTANGSGGCNRFMTGYTVGDAQSLTFDPIASSLRLCGEPADGRERRYLAILEATASYNVANGRLRLTTGNGGELVYAAPASAPAVPAERPAQLPATGDEATPLWVALLALASIGATSIAVGMGVRKAAMYRL